MNWQQALRQRLLDDVTVAGLAGTRVDWGARPQGSALPAVVLVLVSDARPQHMKDFQQLRESRVQADCYAAKQADAAALREAVISALVPSGAFSDVRFERGFVDGLRDTEENTETGIVHRSSPDLLIWHE